LLAANPWIAAPSALVALQVVGLLLGSWAILVMSRSRLNITPVPLRGAVLVTAGPYRVIRHPMYTSLILAFFPIVYSRPDMVNIVIFTLLVVNLLFKLNYEEKLLREQFEGYECKMEGTWRLFPWIY
jgi:protein-S-isoprenylcysteine O-methyltransferase Ste14